MSWRKPSWVMAGPRCRGAKLLQNIARAASGPGDRASGVDRRPGRFAQWKVKQARPNKEERMTPHDWPICTDPAPMLAHLGPRASDRQWRLFAVACCRRVERWLEDDAVRN